MASDQGLRSHSGQQVEMKKCRSGFHDADASEFCLCPRFWLCTQAVWLTCSTAGWTCCSLASSVSSELSM